MTKFYSRRKPAPELDFGAAGVQQRDEALTRKNGHAMIRSSKVYTRELKAKARGSFFVQKIQARRGFLSFTRLGVWVGTMLEPKLHLMNCMEGMKQFPDKFFDLAIVDPPYGINIANHGGRLVASERPCKVK